MSVWIKEGVCGDLCPELTKELGRVINYFYAYHEDFFITSRREGNHIPGSFHYIGRAVDFCKQGIDFDDLKKIISRDFDLINESNHFHLEYDPK